MLRIEHHPNGPRVYVYELRLHHGLAGIALAAAGVALHEPTLVLAGAALVVDDLRDFPWRLRERDALNRVSEPNAVPA